VNRTDRLYAVTEELRAVAPRPRSATWLARRFEVSVRTIERDIDALQQGGVPIWAEPGRTGGYCIDRDRTLPPLNFSPDEAVAVAVALQLTASDSPFHIAGGSALRKLLGAMAERDAANAEDLVERVHVIGVPERETSVPRELAAAVSQRRVLRLRYTDRDGRQTVRDVEPLGYIRSTTAWYLLGWCRMRDAPRAFRFDRIDGVTALSERVSPRALSVDDIQVPEGDLRSLTLL